MLFAVDEDVAARLDALAADTKALEAAAAAVEKAVLSGKKVYVYGCGATGRLAKQMESAFWRPFWRKVKADDKLWKKLAPAVGADIEDRLIGEMTGADRALISSLEGFEDLLLIGRLQLEDRGVRKGDVVICVTEGGETSSVIGTILAALDQWKAAPGYDPAESRKSLYFVYNNPDDRLLPFTRSRRVIEEPGITRINLTTGPQSITGSTRMQATTSETYVVGAVLEAAVRRALGRTLSAKELGRIGFEGSWDIAGALRDFRRVLDSVKDAVPALVRSRTPSPPPTRPAASRPTSPGKASSRSSPTPPSGARRSASSRWTRSGRRSGSAGSRSGRKRRTRGRPGSPSSDARSAGSTRRSTAGPSRTRSRTLICGRPPWRA